MPATDSFAVETPIECKNLEEIDLSCFHRRKNYFSGRFTKGKFPPFEINVIKSTNDIGQFSNIDLKDFAKSKDNKTIRLLSIGDSMVEALQVHNSDSFHGLFNNESIINNSYQNKKRYKFISTAIGPSGMAFPNYIQYLKYVSSITSLESDFVLISIQPNDFDESLKNIHITEEDRRGHFS